MAIHLSDVASSSRWSYHRNMEGERVHAYFCPAESIVPAGYIIRNGKPPKLTYLARMIIGKHNEFPDKAFDKLKLAKDYVEKNDFIWKLRGN